MVSQVWKDILTAPKLCALPPTTEAFKENVARVHLQVAIWLHALDQDPPSLELNEHGWSQEEGSNVHNPITVPADILLAPPELLKLIKCSLMDMFCAKLSGPIFLFEPPKTVEFMHNIGALIDCSAFGEPQPRISWINEEGEEIKSRLKIRTIHSNGSLHFFPFTSDQYNHEHHSASYRCKASNTFGSIISHQVHIQAVIDRSYVTTVYDDYVIEGNTAVLKCNIPNYIRRDVNVIGWRLEDNSFISIKNTDKKYGVFSSGHLHIRQVKFSDGELQFWCETKHRLSGRTQLSSVSGKLTITGHLTSIPPKITHFEKEIVMSPSDTKIMLPCAAQGSPVPRNRWFYGKHRSKNKEIPSDYIEGESLLITDKIEVGDHHYTCLVESKSGSDARTVKVIRRETLSAYITPEIQERDIGDHVHIKCTANGHPIRYINWYHNSKRLTTDERIDVNDDSLEIKDLSRDDIGMYQCMTKNRWQEIQSTSQLSIGKTSPLLFHKFEGKTLQPGPSVSLKCSFTSDPPPRTSWTIDKRTVDLSSRIQSNSYLNKVNGQIVSYLNISSAKWEDGGLYGCTASNIVGNISHFARINVYGLPSVRQMDNITVINGNSVSVVCPYYGYPVSSISWSKG
ncbi:Down syndrome cell adhesion molecule-like protein Dscam2 [Nymphon striatum]|nr:Down syndrome cell adhesion molecule-like protein Dscam2 [Nymphon striatum]